MKNNEDLKRLEEALKNNSAMVYQVAEKEFDVKQEAPPLPSPGAGGALSAPVGGAGGTKLAPAANAAAEPIAVNMGSLAEAVKARQKQVATNAPLDQAELKRKQEMEAAQDKKNRETEAEFRKGFDQIMGKAPASIAAAPALAAPSMLAAGSEAEMMPPPPPPPAAPSLGAVGNYEEQKRKNQEAEINRLGDRVKKLEELKNKVSLLGNTQLLIDINSAIEKDKSDLSFKFYQQEPKKATSMPIAKNVDPKQAQTEGLIKAALRAKEGDQTERERLLAEKTEELEGVNKAIAALSKKIAELEPKLNTQEAEEVKQLREERLKDIKERLDELEKLKATQESQIQISSTNWGNAVKSARIRLEGKPYSYDENEADLVIKSTKAFDEVKQNSKALDTEL